MKIKLNRKRRNHLYTHGWLTINDKRATLTVEPTQAMLPPGHYLLQLVNKNAHKRELVIFHTDGTPTQWQIGPQNSWIDSRKNHTIGIGQQLIPGAMYKAGPIFKRIIKRLEKCAMRREPMELIITDAHCTTGTPICHWLRQKESGNEVTLKITES